MSTNKMKSKKKAPAKVVNAKSKNPTKTTKSKVEVAKININIPKPLHTKTKRFSLKNNITIQEIVSAALKEYIDNPAVIDANSGIKRAV